jgi:hypothetical protein
VGRLLLGLVSVFALIRGFGLDITTRLWVIDHNSSALQVTTSQTKQTFKSDDAYDPNPSSCGFHTFRSPLHFEGLPQLVEVFTVEDWVYFAVLNQGICEPEWRGAQSFTNRTFLCEFSSGAVVESDPVPPPDGTVWTDAIALVRCRLPRREFLLLQANEGDALSSMTVNLRATVNLELDVVSQLDWKMGFAGQLGVYDNLPLCPRAWPDYKGRKAKPKRKRLLSVVTQILMEYETFEAENRIRVEVPPQQILSWLEYNLMIGLEHFYIFDNDPKQHGPLEQLLMPYIEEGLVTYVWYPLRDCFRKSNDELDGSRMTISQAMSSTTAIRRYAHETTFMGHFDIDEYIQLPEGVSDIRTLLPTTNDVYSTLWHPQTWYHSCNLRMSSSKTSNVVDFDNKLCVSTDTTPGKSSMRTSDILALFVHSPWVKTDSSLFEWDKEAKQVDGLEIAHIRGRRALDGIPIKTYDHRFIVQDVDKRQILQAKVEERMKQFRRLRD